MASVTQVISEALGIASDNNFVYYDASQGETNGLGAVTIPYTMDCATFLCYAIYLANGWTWYNQPYGYFWPHISQAGFDDFLVNTIGLTKWSYTIGMQMEIGDIVITTENLHHAFMYIGSNILVDANDYFGHGANSIATRSFPTYSESEFAYVYRWSTTPPTPPTPSGRKKMPLWMMLRNPYLYK